MPTYDLKITGGTLIDGTGRERFTGDVGVKDGRVVAVGEVEGEARRTLDASGAIVTPGFTDLHTHYDGQISWDEELAPSSIHGVTTTVIGSCGVGFAPVRPADRERLVAIMEGVEDIPGTALTEGITWDWESFPEYMHALDAMPHSIDFLCQLPHDAMRVYVMGDRAVAEEAATEDDIRQMKAIVREALAAGAVGLSTGRTDNHRSATGEFTPASEATIEELVGIAGVFSEFKHGVLQVVNDFNIMQGDQDFDAEFRVIERMLEAAGGRPASVSVMQRDHSHNQWRWILDRAEQLAARGLTLRAQVAPRAIGVMLGLQATFHPFMGFPTYKTLHHLPLEEQVRRLQDPAIKAKILSEKSEPVGGDGSKLPALADFFLANIDMLAMRLFRLGESPNYEPGIQDSVAKEAMDRGASVMSVLYDILLEDGGRSLLYFPLYNYSGMNLDVVREMLAHPLALPGLSDAGAHVGTVCDASFPTFLMTYWGRDRATGRFPLERLVKMQTHDTSRYLGLQDRGTIAVGQRADLNVIDFDRLTLRAPHMVNDLPAGGRRLMQEAEGYVATFVAGECIAEGGRLTGARPGRLVRAGR